MKKTGFNGYVHDFSVDYDATDVDDIIYIHKYLMKKMTKGNKMFRFVKKVLFLGLAFLSTLTSVNSLRCISTNNQECKVRPQIVNVTSDEPVFFPFSIKTSRCSGSCNHLNDLYAKICIPSMSRTNETRHTKWHEACTCKCRLDSSVCNNKERWNNDKCRCECEE